LHSADDIVSRQRPPDPLQLELADRLDFHGMLDLHQNSRADEDLSWLGLIAKTGGHVRHRTDGIVEASFKTDGAERSKAVRNADAKSDSSRTSSAISTACSAGFSTGTGSLNTTITPSPA
jgi:hypothetical protein